MSFEGHPFRWVPSLQHMTEVKIIETLWRNCKAGNITPPGSVISFSTMAPKIQSKVDGLQIPDKLKRHLKYPMDGMITEAIGWIHQTNQDNPHPNELQDRTEALRYFSNNLCFNNFGCVDGRKTLESYVKDKEIVGYWVWHELCLYCIEDKIVEFSKKFNWQECSNCLNSQLSVYWYRKIHGELPSDEMLTSRSHLPLDKARHFGVFSNGENIVKSMLKALITIYSECRSVAAIVHFQNQLNNDEEFNKLVANSLTQLYEVGEVFIYLLRIRPTGASLEPIANYADDLIRKLTQWPWIFFINDWKRMFETNISATFFMSFFHWMGKAIPHMEEQYRVVLYRVFERIVGIFHERFISNSEFIAEAFWNIFFTENVAYMCTLMLKGLESDQKKFVIRGMRRYVHIKLVGDTNRSIHFFYNCETGEFLSRSSFQETGNRVFLGEERAFFWETYDQYCLETRSNPQEFEG